MADVLIYTAVIGDYDCIQALDCVSTRCDYLCIVDASFSGSVPRPWKMVRLPESTLSSKDLARYCKIFGGELFPQYKYSLWLDGNIGVCGQVEPLLDRLVGHCDIACYEHWRRENVEQEMYQCALVGHDFAWLLRKQLNRYSESGFRSASLFETNILFRSYQNGAVQKMMALWWDEYCRGGKRDQYSLTFCAHQLSIEIASMGRHDARFDNQYFTYSHHPKKRGVSLTKIRRLMKILSNKLYCSISGWCVDQPPMPEDIKGVSEG